MNRRDSEMVPQAELHVRGLTTGYGGHVVLRGVNLELMGGQLVSLLGGNGAGKSTLLKTIMGSLPALLGRIELGGVAVQRWRTPRRVAAGMAYSPEGRRVFSTMTVKANLLVGAAARPRQEDQEGLERAVVLFPELGARMEQRAGTLSGGEQQMLAIARALMPRPRVLLVEEPSQGLAPLVIDRVYEALRTTAAEGAAVLVAEQFQQVREDASDRILVIDSGRIREDMTVLPTDSVQGAGAEVAR